MKFKITQLTQSIHWDRRRETSPSEYCSKRLLKSESSNNTRSTLKNGPVRPSKGHKELRWRFKITPYHRQELKALAKVNWGKGSLYWLTLIDTFKSWQRGMPWLDQDRPIERRAICLLKSGMTHWEVRVARKRWRLRKLLLNHSRLASNKRRPFPSRMTSRCHLLRMQSHCEKHKRPLCPADWQLSGKQETVSQWQSPGLSGMKQTCCHLPSIALYRVLRSGPAAEFLNRSNQLEKVLTG